MSDEVREAVQAELSDLQERLVAIAQQEVARFAQDLAAKLDELERVEVETGSGDVQIVVTLSELTDALKQLAAEIGGDTQATQPA